MYPSVRLFGIRIDAITSEQAVTQIWDWTDESDTAILARLVISESDIPLSKIAANGVESGAYRGNTVAMKLPVHHGARG